MFAFINFMGGYLAGTSYTYKNKNLLASSSKNPPDSPELHLSDFTDIQVIAKEPPLGVCLLVKCTFTNGKQSLASVSYSMLEIIQIFLFNKEFLTEDDVRFFPKSNATLLFICFLVLMLIIIVKN